MEYRTRLVQPRTPDTDYRAEGILHPMAVKLNIEEAQLEGAAFCRAPAGVSWMYNRARGGVGWRTKSLP